LFIVKITAKQGDSTLKITTTIDGITLEGEITFLSSADVRVKITSPFTNVSKGTHIPYFDRVEEIFVVE